VSQIVFEGEADSRAPLLLPPQTATSPIVATLVRHGIVPSERAARAAVIAAASLAVSAAFASVYLSLPDRGRAGVEYAALSAAERAELPAAERAYLENAELIRREREASPAANPRQ
jgi:hypothetical protein